MKDIRIFVASSKELEKERNYLAFLVLAHEDEFAARGLRVRLAKWEYVDPKMTEARTEDRYLDEMYNCDAALVLFRDIAGMYTREELDEALAKEGASRLKAHQILFAADGKPDSDAAKLRAQMDEDGIDYHIWSGLDELRAEFLALVDRVAQCERLVDAPSDKYVRKITAFLAADEADEELAKVRDAFADTVLNINDLLEQAHRNIRVQLNVYGPTNAESVIQSSEMGLVLYRTNYRVFGKEEVGRAYERVRNNQNPKFYVFFQTLDEATEKMLDEAFRTFRSDFVSKFGHFTCKFGDANALRLSFILSLERYAGELLERKEIFSTVQIPELGEPFVGRDEELRRLCGLLEPVPGKFPAGRLPVITGAGGTGKSTLVRQYASQLRVQYPGGVFQVDMERRRTWDEAFLGILDGKPNNGVAVKTFLGLDEDKKPDGADRESGGKRTKEPMTGAKVRDALLRKARENGPVLLVLDNVEGFEEMLGEDGSFAKAFPSSFSERVHVNIVATARTCDVPLGENDWAQVFPLGDLSLDAALELLFADKKAESEEEKKGAERVAELLGRRALFLRRVPGILKGMKKKSDLVCRTYAGLAKELEKDVLETIGKTGWVDPSYWPARLWEIVQGNLAEWGLGEACIKLVKIASFFSPDGFPKHILRHLWNELVYPGLENWGTQKDVFTEVVDLAKKYNLFQSVDPIRIHRLDRAAILQTARNEPGLEEAVGKSLASYYGMSPKYWLLLADNVGILRFASEEARSSAFYDDVLQADISIEARLLVLNDSFQSECRWDCLSDQDWFKILTVIPRLAVRCPWERIKLKGFAWVILFALQPQIPDEQPQLADFCPWEQIDLHEWKWLVRNEPQVANRCPLEKLNGEKWSILLTEQPKFADRCSWEKLCGRDWARLLQEQPQFAVRCPWEKLDGSAWANLLRKQPRFAYRCLWEKLDGKNWSTLLQEHPQFADMCPWEKLDGRDWACLLEDQPQFAERCSWEKFDGSDWAWLLRAQPNSQFADRCPWEKLDSLDWGNLLKEQPKFADRFSLEKLDGEKWSILLTEQPKLADRCSWEKLGGGDWAYLLQEQPQFADRCMWEKLNVEDWEQLLSSMPQFADRCSWGKLEGDDWANLLRKQPQFADRCPWEKFDGRSWSWLLQEHPQFADMCPWEKLDGRDWACLLEDQPQFAERCSWEKFDGSDWAWLLRAQPNSQFADRCPWEKLDSWDWGNLLEKQPKFANNCPWEKFNVKTWIRLLKERPQFARHCPWHMINGWGVARLLGLLPRFIDYCNLGRLNGSDWAWLVGHQPQFADRCPWEKMDRYDWAVLIRLIRLRPPTVSSREQVQLAQLADRCPYGNPMFWDKDVDQDLTESEHLCKIEVLQRLVRYDWGLPRDDRDHFEFELCYALKRLVVFYISHDQSKVENAAVRWLEVNRRITKYQYGFEEAIAEALHFLAAHHRERNRIDEAVKEYSEAFEVRQDIENHDVAWDEDVVDALYELGKKLLQQGDRDKAEKVLSRTLDFRCRLAEKNPEKYAKAVTEAEAALKECQR